MAYAASIAALLAAACILAVVKAAPLSPQLVVDTASGPVQGEVANDVRAFLGVPFAKPPLGDLRFREPQPIEFWEEPLPCVNYAPACYQNGARVGVVSEDCLYLNVWTPLDTTAGDDLPVLVFLHGGAFSAGATNDPLYRGDRVARQGRAITVTIAYRLGAFGFLASEALRSQTPDGSVGNYGLQDQRAGLQWVQENIAAFGGNPDKVMLYGESAGGASVSLHMLMKKSAGLFNTAVIESGAYAFWTSNKVDGAAAGTYATVVKGLGCAGSAEEIVACLKGAPAAALFEAQKAVSLWAPTFDRVEFPEDPLKMAETGQFSNNVPLIVGSNLNEGTLFVAEVIGEKVNWLVYQAALTAIFGLGNAAKINSLYPDKDYTDLWWRMADEVGDWSFVCPARRTARLHAAHSTHGTYAYFFTMANRNSSAICRGVCHGLELVYVLNKTDELLTPAEFQLAEDMTTYWANFAATGSPSAGPSTVSQDWPAFAEDAQQYINFDANLNIIENLRTERCNFWDTVEATPFADRNPNYPMSLEGLRRAIRDAEAGRLPLVPPMVQA